MKLKTSTSMFYSNKKGQIVGEMRNGIYLKRVKKDIHFMKIFQGYGISKSVLEKLKEDGCKEIRISEDNNKLYRIFFVDFLRHGIEKDFDDLQVFCSIKYFDEKVIQNNP